MRERTTWTMGTNKAAADKQADDPRAMNQDHHKQQPSHDKYTIGDSSDFGEDVHPSGGTWKAEYSGGEVKRNEIGMPEMRGDTFNHAEKTAADEATLMKKANLCIRVAKAMLKGASKSVVEDQAYGFMYLPDSELVAMSNRLAGLSVEAKDASDDEDEDESDDDSEQQSKQAGLPPEFLKNIKEKKDDAKDDGDDKKQQGDKKQSKDASQQQGEDEDKDESKDQSKEAASKLAQDMQQLAQQLQQMQSQMQQMMQGGQQQQAPAQQQQMAQQAPAQQQMAQQDDQLLLDQMLQQDGGLGDDMFLASEEIQLEGAQMDVGETVLAAEDDALHGLFAQDQEYQNALTANQLQGIHSSVSAPSAVTASMARTASTRTVGTRPSQGVSQLGGASSGAPSGNDVDRLSNLWQSAPDVSGVFRS